MEKEVGGKDISVKYAKRVFKKRDNRKENNVEFGMITPGENNHSSNSQESIKKAFHGFEPLFKNQIRTVQKYPRKR